LEAHAPDFPPLYAVLDPEYTRSPILELAGRLSVAGVKLVQLRDKNAPARRIFEQSRELIALLVPRGVRFILNDRPDIARIVQAGGVHVGQEDLPIEDARTICPAPCWVGLSTHNMEQLRQAVHTSADYIAVGPVFPTSTKQNPDPIVGLELLREARKLTHKPLVAIGGITLERAADVYAAGADSVAVIGDLLSASDPAERARAFLEVAGQARLPRH
jgi:thiamine-phosphate pyrophosphorylase